MHEAELYDENSFITLTYDEKHLPKHGSLQVHHWQTFAKALRKHKRGGKFRFFHCGEYGETHGRPHYHAAIFNQAFLHDRVYEKSAKGGEALYSSQTLTDCWPHGSHWIGELSYQSAAYVARYIMKKVTGVNAERHYGQLVDTSTGEVTWRRHPEYTTMSRNPGIGKKWIDLYMSDVYPADEVITQGRPCKPPKFYDQQFEKLDPKGWQKVKALREVRGQGRDWNNTYDRLTVRETVQNARMSHFTRDL